MAEDTLMEEREELMVSHHQPHIRRLGRFLKPSLTSIDAQPFLQNHHSQLSSLEVAFKGSRTPTKGWKSWVDRMHSLHQSTWKTAGIYDALMNSSYQININEDLILGLAEKWQPDTNSFVFTWGESTITLEDMIILGGYSVLGESVLDPLEESVLDSLEESQEIFTKLEEARLEIQRSKSNKAAQSKWLTNFKDNSESKIEHEAFLVLWLTRFVFPSSYSTVVKNVFTIAIRLARGIRIALAPAVLASIYRDLSLLTPKSVIGNHDDLSVIVRAPFQLVQIWIMERFTKQSAKDPCEPRFARWDKKKLVKDEVLSILDCGLESFCWRPYIDCKVYQEKERWVVVSDYLDEDLESWVRCVRPSELVGIDGSSCIEQYLPHRVSMQFGMDQDIPGEVSQRHNESPEAAWRFYTRHVKDVEIYVPSRSFETCVTVRYFKWWNKGQTRNSSNEDHQKVSDCIKYTSPFGDDEPLHDSVEDEFTTQVSADSDSDSDVPQNTLTDEANRMGLELEARITKLEEVYAYLKAQKQMGYL